jgi:hypothetical protein
MAWRRESEALCTEDLYESALSDLGSRLLLFFLSRSGLLLPEFYMAMHRQ